MWLNFCSRDRFSEVSVSQPIIHQSVGFSPTIRFIIFTQNYFQNPLIISRQRRLICLLFCASDVQNISKIVCWLSCLKNRIKTTQVNTAIRHWQFQSRRFSAVILVGQSPNSAGNFTFQLVLADAIRPVGDIHRIALSKSKYCSSPMVFFCSATGRNFIALWNILAHTSMQIQ